jgi:hypothetical protein
MSDTPSASRATRSLVVPLKNSEVTKRRSLLHSEREARSTYIEPSAENDLHYARGSDCEQSLSSDSDSAPLLSDELRKKLICCMKKSQFEKTSTQFLPRHTFETFLADRVTGPNYNHSAEDIVLEIMCIEPKTSNEDDRALARYILDSAKTLFLITLYIEAEPLHTAMASFKKHDFNDLRLPIEEWCSEQLENDSDNHLFVQMEGRRKKKKERIWTVMSIHQFEQSQWKFLAAVISTAHTNQNFGHRTMPFVSKLTKAGNGGAHGIVYRYEIHPAHFEDPQCPVMYVIYMACFID